MSGLYLSGGIPRLGEFRIVRRWLRPGRRWRLAARIRSFGLARLASSQLGRRIESKRERRARRYVCATAPATARTRASIPVGPVSRQAHFTLTPFLVVIVPCVDRGSTFDSRSTTDRIFAAVTGVIAAKNRRMTGDPWMNGAISRSKQITTSSWVIEPWCQRQYTFSGPCFKIGRDWRIEKFAGIRKMCTIKEKNEWET